MIEDDDAMISGVRPSHLLSLLVLLLALPQLLLWRFLDFMPLWGYALGVAAIGIVIAAIGRHSDPKRIAWRTLLLCVVPAALLFLLGGQGRLFYANIDWQVRDAVLRDLAIHPWPFVYSVRDTQDLLRAPIGMYLLPAMAFGGWGVRAGEIVLLVQNSALLTILLALGSQLFDTARRRLAALGIMLAFSGLDVLGPIMLNDPISDHMENWLAGVQFSSTVTLAFWVPNHAIPGWTGALLFLLWRDGLIRSGTFLAIMPFAALWSPLSLLGTLPFAAFVGLADLYRRRLNLWDILLPALATLIVIPSLIYLNADTGAVGARFQSMAFRHYAAFQAIETLPWLLPIAFALRRTPRDALLLGLIALLLFLLPFVQIGWSSDLMMRGSIPALTILAFLGARCLTQPGNLAASPIRIWLLITLIIGSMTGLSEIARAFRHPTSPRGTCSVFKAWQQSFGKFPMTTYVAPANALPSWMRPQKPTILPATEPEKCWEGNWYRPPNV